MCVRACVRVFVCVCVQARACVVWSLCCFSMPETLCQIVYSASRVPGDAAYTILSACGVLRSLWGTVSTVDCMLSSVGTIIPCIHATGILKATVLAAHTDTPHTHYAHTHLQNIMKSPVLSVGCNTSTLDALRLVIF